jgi:hypothetical protein
MQHLHAVHQRDACEHRGRDLHRLVHLRFRYAQAVQRLGVGVDAVGAFLRVRDRQRDQRLFACVEQAWLHHLAVVAEEGFAQRRVRARDLAEALEVFGLVVGTRTAAGAVPRRCGRGAAGRVRRCRAGLRRPQVAAGTVEVDHQRTEGELDRNVGVPAAAFRIQPVLLGDAGMAAVHRLVGTALRRMQPALPRGEAGQGVEGGARSGVGRAQVDAEVVEEGPRAPIRRRLAQLVLRHRDMRKNCVHAAREAPLHEAILLVV